MQKNTGTFGPTDGVAAAGVSKADAYSFMCAVLKGPSK